MPPEFHSWTARLGRGRLPGATDLGGRREAPRLLQQNRLERKISTGQLTRVCSVGAHSRAPYNPLINTEFLGDIYTHGDQEYV